MKIVYRAPYDSLTFKLHHKFIDYEIVKLFADAWNTLSDVNQRINANKAVTKYTYYARSENAAWKSELLSGVLRYFASPAEFQHYLLVLRDCKRRNLLKHMSDQVIEIYYFFVPACNSYFC